MNENNPPGIIKPQHESFMQFLWNSDRKEFLGRSGLSWFKITVFYIIYYICLAAFWALMMFVFYQTLDTQIRPTYVLEESILSSPALGFRPSSKDNVGSTIIHFNKKKEEKMVNNTIVNDPEAPYPTATYWANMLDKFSQTHEKEFADILGGGDNKNVNTAHTCKPEHHWGYANNKPCVILKMNKMIDWEPEVLTDEEVTQQIIERKELNGFMSKMISDTARVENNIVWLTCEGENAPDKQHIHNIDMYPRPGFLASNFPYSKVTEETIAEIKKNNKDIKEEDLPKIGQQDRYVAVVFDVERNLLVNIECRIWARNIAHDSKNKLGLVRFEILSDEKSELMTNAKEEM